MSVEDLSMEFKSNVFYGVSKNIYELSKEKIVPQLSAIMKLADMSSKKPTLKEHALVGIYFRVHGWLESVALMNTSACFQGVAVAARAIFELVLDLELLDNDLLGNNLLKFNAFPLMHRSEAAAKCLKHFKETKQQPRIFREEHLLREINVNHELIEKNLKDIFEGKKSSDIKHWSGINSVGSRAKAVGGEYENLYMEFYPLLSWAVHSGATLHGGRSRESLETYMHISHGFVIELSSKAIKVMAKNFELGKIIENLNVYLNVVKDMPYEIMAKESERLKKEPF